MSRFSSVCARQTRPPTRIAAIRRGGALWTALAALAAVGGALAAAYFLRLLFRVTHGAASPAVTGIPRLTAGEVAAWAPLIVLALGIGLLPATVIGVAHDAVAVLVP